MVLLVKSDIPLSRQPNHSVTWVFTLTFIFKEYSKLEAMLSVFLRTIKLEYFAKAIVEGTYPTIKNCCAPFNNLVGFPASKNGSSESLCFKTYRFDDEISKLHILLR